MKSASVIRVVDPDPDPRGSAFVLVGGNRIWIQKCKNVSQLNRIVKKFHVLKFWCSFLSAEVFSFSLDVFYGGQGISQLQFLNLKNNFFFTCKFFTFLVPKCWFHNSELWIWMGGRGDYYGSGS